MQKQQAKVDITWMNEGQKCWVDVENDAEEQKKEKDKKEKLRDQLIYVKGQITKLEHNKNQAIIYFERDKSTKEVPLARLIEKNLDEELKEDMVDMPVLNEPEILQNIKKYYQDDKIFTRIGPTLIVVNPYKYIPELFSDEVFEKIRTESQQPNYDFTQSQPHVWSIAANAYSSLFDEHKNQAIVISGESGAGKTENTKFAMKFLTSLSENKNLFVVKEDQEDDNSIEEKILRCNPILEAFGNAKTVRNDNSSRFGKYVRIWLNGSNKKILGASITKYLLEKTRVTTVGEGERNYHIFYHFIKGCKELSKYGISEDPKSYKFLDSDCINVAGVKDLELYEQVIASFKKLGFTSDEQDSIFKIVAGILHLGNVEFDESKYNDDNPCDVANKDVLKQAADQLQVNVDELQRSITLKIRTVGKQVIESPINANECAILRDTLAKGLYDRLFDWLTLRLNKGIEPEESCQDALSLGLLDIFGFENFEINSFEQLCINFTNEKLQQLYIEYVFKSEKKEFIAEGLQDKLTALEYKDNQDVIDLIEKKREGIMELLDESCSLGNSTDVQLLNNIQKQHAASKTLVHSKIQSKDSFIVIHTAKDVEYKIDGFRLKNKDEVVASISDTIEKTEDKNIKTIWNVNETANADGGQKKKGKGDKFLGAKFRASMNELMTELQSCGVHFIRCLKTNEQKLRGTFHQAFVMQQIRYLGILESVRQRKEGFPFRLKYNQFYDRYHDINPKFLGCPLKKIKDNPDKVRADSQEVIDHIFKDYKGDMKNSILRGKTKIYMRFETSQQVGEAQKKWMKHKETFLSRIQRQGKRYAYRQYTLRNLSILVRRIKIFIKIQAVFRAQKIRRVVQKLLARKRALENCQKIQHKFLKEALRKYQAQVILKKVGAKEQERILKELEEKRQQQELEKQGKAVKQNPEEQKAAAQKQEETKAQEEQSAQKQDEESEYPDIWKDDFTNTADNMFPLWKTDMRKLRTDYKEGDNSTSSAKLQQLMGGERSSRRISRIPTFVQVNESISSIEDSTQIIDYLSTYIEKVVAADFLTYCEKTVVRGQNFKKQAKMDKIMGFSKDSLKEPLTFCPDYAREADLTFRSLLKIGGNRRSRFPMSFQQSNVISLGLGQDSLDGQEEAQLYLTQIFSQQLKQSSYGKKLAEKYNSNVLMPSDRGNFNPQQIIIKLINQVMSDKLIPLRDEIYLQICKQIEGNSSEGMRKLYKFCSIISNVFAPSKKLILPLLNFFYQKHTQEKHKDLKQEALYIFNKLSFFYQSYQVISDMPSTLTKDLLAKAQILKSDPIQLYLNDKKFGLPCPFQFMEMHITNLTQRKILPVKDEIKQIGDRQDRLVEINLFSESSENIKITASSSKSVYQIKNLAVQEIGLSHLQHCFGLYEIKYVNDKIEQEQFLADGDKIMDILNSQKNEEFYYFNQLGKNLHCILYLKMRFCYPFTKNDSDTISLLYNQIMFDSQKKQTPFNTNSIDQINIAAHYLFIKFGTQSKDAEKFVKLNFKLLITDLFKNHQLTPEQWQQRILSQYKQLNYSSATAAQFGCLNIYRKFERFISHDFEGKQFLVAQQGEGYAKSKEPIHCMLCIKPLLIFIQAKAGNVVEEIPMTKIASWGKSVGGNSSYFYIKTTTNRLYIFSLKNLIWPDYLLNIYKNYSNDKETFSKQNCRYFDTLSFLMNNITDQEEQIEDKLLEDDKATEIKL